MVDLSDGARMWLNKWIKQYRLYAYMDSPDTNIILCGVLQKIHVLLLADNTKAHYVVGYTNIHLLLKMRKSVGNVLMEAFFANLKCNYTILVLLTTKSSFNQWHRLWISNHRNIEIQISSCLKWPETELICHTCHLVGKSFTDGFCSQMASNTEISFLLWRFHKTFSTGQLNPVGICDNDLSLNRYLQAHPGDTEKCPSKLTAFIYIYQLSILDIQRCTTYTYVHVCGYLFSTVVCHGYVCLCIHASLRAHVYT